MTSQEREPVHLVSVRVPVSLKGELDVHVASHGGSANSTIIDFIRRGLACAKVSEVKP